MSIQMEPGPMSFFGMQPCTVCGAKVNELRRGRCWSCYTRWAEMRPVGINAACRVCNERRRDNLRMSELHGRSVPMCHNCAARLLKLSPMPPTLEEIRILLERERRADERRDGGYDHRLFPRERRIGDRRSMGGETQPEGVDFAVFFPDIEEMITELGEDDIEVLEQTLVREAPRRA